MTETNPEFCYRFKRAISRQPAKSIVNGLRAEDHGNPDFEQMQKDHAHYVEALRQTGAEVTVLPPVENYPDSVFVEDVALCLPEVAILMRPGAPTRRGEVDEMAETMKFFFTTVLEIKGPGFIEAGDILTTAQEILVGSSARTDSAGIEELRDLVSAYGYKVREVITPPDVLHFKTDCSLLDADTILSTKRLDATGCFKNYNVIHTADGEEASANSIRFNDLVLMPAGFPETKSTLVKHGYNVQEINNSECAKIDGGMSCLSLRFN